MWAGDVSKQKCGHVAAAFLNFLAAFIQAAMSNRSTIAANLVPREGFRVDVTFVALVVLFETYLVTIVFLSFVIYPQGVFVIDKCVSDGRFSV